MQRGQQHHRANGGLCFFAVLSAFCFLPTANAQTGIGVLLPFQFAHPGFYFEYYPSGQLKLEGVYLWQDTIRCVACYMEGADRTTTYSLEHLMRVGEWKEFYETGTLKARGHYYGIHEVYGVNWPMKYGESSNGLVPGDAEIQYLKDKYWYYYSEAGNLVRIEYYHQGMLASREEYKD